MNEIEVNLLNCVATPIFALEPDDENHPRYVAFNDSACRNGEINIEDIIGLTALEAYPEPTGAIAYERHCHALTWGEPITYELTLPSGGRDQHVRTHLHPISDDNGDVVRLIGTSSEINAEYAAREAAARAIMHDSEISNFVALAAHDLRSPIRRVQTIAELLREDFKDLGDGKLTLINMLEGIALKATSLIGDVLAHAESTQATESIEGFDLDQLCTDIMLMLDPGEEHSLQSEACVLFGDKIATQIALRNLIDNAIKHNADSRVNLSVSAQAESAGYFTVTVEDDGVGLPDSTIAFLNQDRGKFRSEFGFGLLGIQRLLTARGGSITAEKPDSGIGSKIQLTLPGKILDSSIDP